MATKNPTTVPILAFGLPELSKSTGMSISYWRKRIAAGELRATRLGRRVVVLADEVQRYLDARIR